MAIINRTAKELQAKMEEVARNLVEHPMVAERDYNDLQDAVSRLVEQFEKMVPALNSNPSQRIRFAELRTDALAKIRALQENEIMELGDTMLGEEG